MANYSMLRSTHQQGLTPELRGRESVRFLFPLSELLGQAYQMRYAVASREAEWLWPRYAEKHGSVNWMIRDTRRGDCARPTRTFGAVDRP